MLWSYSLRREKLIQLSAKDFSQDRWGVAHLAVQRKGNKLRYLLARGCYLHLVAEYLTAADHGGEVDTPLFKESRHPSRVL